jgi:hypothetical protein
VYAIRAIHQDTQHFGQLRQVLDFINDNQALQVTQSGHRVEQALARNRVFKVKVVSAVGVNKLSGDGGFSHLTRANQFHSPKGLEQFSEMLTEM